MKKFAALILLAALLLTGCGTAAPAESTAEPTGTSAPAESAPANVLTFTDDLGREISLDAVPQRTACLLGSFADLWTLAGGTCIASPNDAWDDYQLDMPEDATDLGGAMRPSLEKLLAAEPDFILASVSSKTHMEWKDTLEAAGIPVAYFKVSGYEDYLRMLKVCTDLLGNPEAYETYGAAVEAEIDAAVAAAQEAVAAGAEVPSILHMRMAASGLRVKNSRGNVLGEMAKELGCDNIADSDESLLENLSMEHILVQDPDFILLVQQGDDTEGAKAVLDAFIAENPAWQQLSAVQNDRVLILEKRLFSLKPNALWGQAFTQLQQLLFAQ